MTRVTEHEGTQGLFTAQFSNLISRLDQGADDKLVRGSDPGVRQGHHANPIPLQRSGIGPKLDEAYHDIPTSPACTGSLFQVD